MYQLVQDVLSSTGVLERYLTSFKDKGICDNLIKTVLAKETDPVILREVIPDANLRHEFVKAFREKLFSDETSRLAPIQIPPSLSHHETVAQDLAALLQRTLDVKKKEDQVTVKLALADAKEYYQARMQSIRQAKRWHPPAEFKNINDRLLADCVQKSQQDEGLTAEQAKSLEQALRGLYLKFQQENDSQPGQSYAIGIDLGTTHSCVGVYKEGHVEIMRQNELFTVPSCVFFEEDGNITVGEGALDGAYRSPEDFIYDAKRLIGRNFTDQVVQDDIKHWSFKVVSSPGDQPCIVCRGKPYRPEEISSKLLAHLKTIAQRHLGQKSLTNAVVTVPAYFNEGQRQATKDAAEMAGLTATILTEPVAAAIAYGFHWNVEFKKNVLVFDLGGGTFDVAILSIERGNIDVKTINGNTHLGGEDFDNEVVKYIIGRLKATRGIDLYEGKDSSDQEVRKRTCNLLRRIKLECERKKRELSYSNVASIRLEDIRLDEKISREVLEALITPYLNKCMEIVEKALLDAEMVKKDIAEVILVGGSTKIPKVTELLNDFFCGSPQIRHTTVDPDQAVAYGAAIFAAIRSSTNQAEGLKVVVSDVTPLSIGTEIVTGKFAMLIPKNSKIPCSKKGSWFTVKDDIKQAHFHIFEGENSVARENHLLGTFKLKVPPRPKGEVVMESETVVDAEGIVTVKVTCLMDGNSNDIRIDTYKGRMSRAEIEEQRTKLALRWK